MSDEKRFIEFKQWLETPAAQEGLNKISRLAAKRMAQENLFPGVIIEPWDPTKTLGPETLKDVNSEICMFLLENKKVQEIMAGGFKGAGGYLLTAFLNHCRNKNRPFDINPRKYFRRVATDVFREFPDLCTDKDGEFVSYYGRQPCDGRLAPLTEEEIRSIGFTEDCRRVFSGARKSAASSKKGMYDALCRFLEQAGNLRGKPGHWVRLEDFIDWLMPNMPPILQADAHLVYHNPPGRDTDGTGPEETEFISDPRHMPDHAYFDAEKVGTWAAMCARRLTGDEKELIYQRHAVNLTLKEIAKMKNVASPATVDNHLKRALGKIRSFLVDKPWLSPDDLNEKAFSLFWEKLCGELKSDAKKP